VKKAGDLLNAGQVPSIKIILVQLRQLFAKLQSGDKDVKWISTKDTTESFGKYGSSLSPLTRAPAGTPTHHRTHSIDQFSQKALSQMRSHCHKWHFGAVTMGTRPHTP